MNPPEPASNAAIRPDGSPRPGDSVARPVGNLQPDDPFARRVLVALGDRRIEDAEQNFRKYTAESPVARAWGAFLRGRVAEARGQLAEAAYAFREAGWTLGMSEVVGSEGGAGKITEAGRGEEPLPGGRGSVSDGVEPLPYGRGSVADGRGSDSRKGPHSGPYERAPVSGGEDSNLRLAALALECLGRVLRRIDDLDRAAEAHRAALDLRERVGSWAECRQSAHELALDAAVARTHNDAIAWHRMALEFAQPLGELGLPLQAETLTHLARSLRATGDLNAATQHARESFDLRQRFDPGSLDTLRAALELAECRLAGAAESAAAADLTACAATELTEAMAALTDLRGEFLAWGGEAEDELARVDEGLDFARRLMESSVVE